MLSRRAFLRGALSLAPVVIAPPALAELLEPRRTIFLPPAGGWLELADITREAFGAQLIVQIYNSSPLLRHLMNPDAYIAGVPIYFDDQTDTIAQGEGELPWILSPS